MGALLCTALEVRQCTEDLWGGLPGPRAHPKSGSRWVSSIDQSDKCLGNLSPQHFSPSSGAGAGATGHFMCISSLCLPSPAPIAHLIGMDDLKAKIKQKLSLLGSKGSGSASGAFSGTGHRLGSGQTQVCDIELTKLSCIQSQGVGHASPCTA